MELERSLGFHGAPFFIRGASPTGGMSVLSGGSRLPPLHALTALTPQIIQRITWVSPPAVTLEWKRKVAQEAIESLSASKLAKSICSQFRTRLNSSHEAFAASLRQVGVREAREEPIRRGIFCPLLFIQFL